MNEAIAFFDNADPGQSGYITREDLEAHLKGLDQIEDSTIEQILDVLIPNKNGILAREEFVAYFERFNTLSKAEEVFETDDTDNINITIKKQDSQVSSEFDEEEWKEFLAKTNISGEDSESLLAIWQAVKSYDPNLVTNLVDFLSAHNESQQKSSSDSKSRIDELCDVFTQEMEQSWQAHNRDVELREAELKKLRQEKLRLEIQLMESNREHSEQKSKLEKFEEELERHSPFRPKAHDHKDAVRKISQDLKAFIRRRNSTGTSKLTESQENLKAKKLFASISNIHRKDRRKKIIPISYENQCDDSPDDESSSVFTVSSDEDQGFEDDKVSLVHAFGFYDPSANSEIEYLSRSSSTSFDAEDDDTSSDFGLLMDFSFKIIICGDAGVGKTSFLNRFCLQTFCEQSVSTVGMAYFKKNLVVEKQLCELHIWDTAGQERFRSLPSSYFRNCDAAVIMYDITNEDSFHNICGWLERLSEFVDEPCVIIVGNKLDLFQQRAVPSSNAISFCRSHGFHYMEISACTGSGIKETFQRLCKTIINNNSVFLETPPKSQKLKLKDKVKAKCLKCN